ncbi:MAG: hypothetical protein EAZ85_09060 [Bacteroidetes bacterium]|nr:MAG: hypothetical protein EAZ85_09060 [Bacteroidota bacterium]TAG88065.1 MAG: hypothetical protein EAZ20_09395 [Bacteroidota bacterium]
MVACGTDKKKALTRKWKVDVEALKTYMKSELEKQKKEKPEGIEMAEKMVDAMVKMMGSIVMDFKADGTLEVGDEKRKNKMKWELSEDKTQIITKDEKNKEQRMKIKSVSSSKLEIEPDEKDKKRGMPLLTLIPA